MEKKNIEHSFWRRLFYFFPFQLLILHVKKNQIMLFLWLLLWGFVSGHFADKYGASALFLSPEYCGQVNFLSFAIIGFALGGFIMAFNITTYIMHGTKFPFVATISKPFYKYCLNNSIIPIVFIGVYILRIWEFQKHTELANTISVLKDIIGFALGLLLFFIASIFYFIRTNKDFFKLTGKNPNDYEPKKRENYIGSQIHKKSNWYKTMNQYKGWHVETYISKLPFKILLARESKHYNQELLQKVFSQNHINASIFEFGLIITYLLIGFFRDIPILAIPAGASVVILLTIGITVFSALYSWLKLWTVTVVIILIIAFNFATSRYDFITENKAYGINYTISPVPYNTDIRQAMITDKKVYNDKAHMLSVLEKWKSKRIRPDGKKPKLILLNVSGGGLRSSLWTYHVLQLADSLLNQTLFDHITMISGSSGGMIGASYFRELYLRKKLGQDIDLKDSIYEDNMAKDILNPVAFSLATNDVFIRYKHFKFGGYEYLKDRGTAFEETLNNNTAGILNKSFSDYKLYEDQGLIPFMVFSPSIVNDGRRLLISSQPIAFLTSRKPIGKISRDVTVEDIEFMKLFHRHDAQNLSFLSAIRMSATFPYVLPLVTLPSEPEIEVMDAGLRDNYGIKSTIQFLLTFHDWIKENTDGVIVLQIRDRQKFDDEIKPVTSWMDRLIAPINILYSNFTKIQDFDHDQLVQELSMWYDDDIDFITFSLFQAKDNPISLSFHLTGIEKLHVLNALNLERNKMAMDKLVKTMKN